VALRSPGTWLPEDTALRFPVSCFITPGTEGYQRTVLRMRTGSVLPPVEDRWSGFQGPPQSRDRPVLGEHCAFAFSLTRVAPADRATLRCTLPGSFVHRPSHILRGALRQTVGDSGRREHSRARMVLRAIIRVVHIQVRRDIDGHGSALFVTDDGSRSIWRGSYGGK
jgi:hypothetical protein